MMRNRPVQIIGVPLDLGASRRGTDAGPSALRIAGLGKGLRKLGYEVSMESDVSVPSMETREAKNESARFKQEILDVCTRLAHTTRKTLELDRIPLVIGGDHSIAMGTVSGVSSFYKEQGGEIGLIWFDAHGDMNVPGSSPSGNIHGMPLSHLLGHGDTDLSNILGVNPAVKPENVALIGVRDIDDHERRIINDSGVAVFTMRDIDEHGMTRVIQEVLEVVNTGTVGFHVSFDVDGCDPTVIPGSGTLVPGGISFREAHQLLENCADTRRMTSMEVAELNPFLDQANISAERTVMLIQSAFGRSII